MYCTFTPIDREVRPFLPVRVQCHNSQLGSVTFNERALIKDFLVFYVQPCKQDVGSINCQSIRFLHIS